MLIKKIRKVVDKTEEQVRRRLSNYPFSYALIGGIGIVLFWRGIWHIADDINMASGISLVIGTIILVSTGIFVSEFIGKRLIISGLVGEKKITEKEEGEIETEESQIRNLQNTLNKLEKKLDHMETHLGGEPIYDDKQDTPSDKK
jgi:hypothetical protein